MRGFFNCINFRGSLVICFPRCPELGHNHRDDKNRTSPIHLTTNKGAEAGSHPASAPVIHYRPQYPLKTLLTFDYNTIVNNILAC